MPLYEYKCHRCGESFEVLQKFSDAPLETHAGCGGVVERLISPPAFHFKGSGWYVTDYAKNNGSSGGNGHNSKKQETASTKTETSTPKPAESKSSGSESSKKT